MLLFGKTNRSYDGTWAAKVGKDGGLSTAHI